jgi:hypothetical protein
MGEVPIIMCDYSPEGLQNRVAVVGEQLVSYRFPTHSIGMASPWDCPKPQASEPRA